MLIGNLGQDAETRVTTSNLSITSFSIATTNSYKGKDGNWINETTWHNCIGFNLPDFYKEGLKKGKKFYIEGRTQKRDYTDKEGIKRYVTEVITEKIIPLDSTPREQQQHEQSGGFVDTPAPDESQSSTDDDLPF